MKALKKNDMGVSPVIAVILMVAITVVLAGVVFLWASSLTNDRDDSGEIFTVDAELTGGVAADAQLSITPTTGNIDWAVCNIIFEGDPLDETGVTSPTETGLTASFTIDMTGATLGDEFDFKIVDTENDRTVVTGTVILKA